MSSMTDPTWPPSDELLGWRPAPAAPDGSLSSSAIGDEGEELPDWVAVPDDAELDEYGNVQVPAYALAHIETDAGRPGGGGISSVYAVPTKDGGLRIVITNDDDVPVQLSPRSSTSMPRRPSKSCCGFSTRPKSKARPSASGTRPVGTATASIAKSFAAS